LVRPPCCRKGVRVKGAERKNYARRFEKKTGRSGGGRITGPLRNLKTKRRLILPIFRKLLGRLHPPILQPPGRRDAGATGAYYLPSGKRRKARRGSGGEKAEKGGAIVQNSRGLLRECELGIVSGFLVVSLPFETSLNKRIEAGRVKEDRQIPRVAPRDLRGRG